jgi:hypothetical protein
VTRSIVCEICYFLVFVLTTCSSLISPGWFWLNKYETGQRNSSNSVLVYFIVLFGSVTSSRARIETSIPRKHGPAIAGYESALKKFFENVLQAFVKHVDFSVVRCAVVASPGFTKDQFHRHLLLEAERRQLRPIIENKSRIILVHTNSGYR